MANENPQVTVTRGLIGWSNWRAGCEFYEDTLPEWPRWIDRTVHGSHDKQPQGALLTDALGDPEGARVVVVVLPRTASDEDVAEIEERIRESA